MLMPGIYLAIASEKSVCWKSLRSYRKALSLDPQHLGAHEYLGELYLMMNKPEKAKKQLKKLRRYCGDCEQAEELSEAIEKYVG